MMIVPPTPAGDTPASTAAEGFLLLTIPDITLSSTSPANPLPQPLKGLLSLECITLDVADPLERDVWLVLRVEPPKKSGESTFELPLASTQRVVLSRSQHRYTLPMVSSGGGELVIKIPEPNTRSQKEDLETLEVLLAQYLVLQIEEDAPPAFEGSSTNFNPDGDLKGRLVLVDEDNGQVVGTLGEQFSVKEDAGLAMEGSEKAPVVVDLPDEDEIPANPRVKREIFVHTIAVDDADWVGKTAGFLGRGIVMATNALSGGMSSAANHYIARTPPTTQPIAFSENTRKNIKRVHNISGKAVKVTSKTTGLIHQTVERLADKVAGKGKSPAGSQYSLQSGLKPGAMMGTPYAAPHPSSQTSLDKEGSQNWTYPYPGGPPNAGSTGSFQPPPYQSAPTPGPQYSGGPPPPPPRRRLLNRLLTSTDLLLTTLESSASHLITQGSSSLSAVASHRYGPDAGAAVSTMGDSVRNVAVVYIDVRGVGRRALLRHAGKSMIKARMGGKEVVFQEQGMGRGQLFPHGVPNTGTGVPVQDTYAPPPFAPPPFPPPHLNQEKGKF